MSEGLPRLRGRWGKWSQERECKGNRRSAVVLKVCREEEGGNKSPGGEKSGKGGGLALRKALVALMLVREEIGAW